MNLLFYCGHPAQYLFFRETVRRLSANGHRSIFIIKTKDVLEDLVRSDGFDYINILPRERGKTKLSIFLSLIKRNLRIFPIILKHKPDILIGGDPSISQLGWLLGKMRFTLTEDDYPVIKSLARLTFPFAQTIITPSVNNVGKWEYKKTGYNGYMKLAYLHPNVFEPKKEIVERYNLEYPYAIIRSARLTAHHDFGVKGLNNSLMADAVRLLVKNDIKPYISAEDDIPEIFRDYQLKIDPADIHHVMNYATLLISDSQSMSMEAAMLGVPALRFSSLSGKISVLEELEHQYGLTFGIQAEEEVQLLTKIEDLLSSENLRESFQKRRQKMLADKIDVTAFMVWFIENYPQSIQVMKENPDYQNRFK